jgi:hypothetical protein
MKIIALYPVLQNKLNINFLKISIKSIYEIVDEIIILFDYPNDKNDLILKNFEDKKIYRYFLEKKNPTIRTNAPVIELLSLGRKHNGSHFIFLDTDEAFTYPFVKNYNNYISSMKPGDKIMLKWLPMWKNHSMYRVDKKSIWSHIYKDFIFCDNLKDNLSNVFGYARTPGNITKNNTIYIDEAEGAVMHFQFANWNNFQLKQAWNMCQHLLIEKMSEPAINRMFFYTNFENFPKLKKINTDWQSHIPHEYFSDIYIDTKEFWFIKFNKLFQENSIKKFEQLNIWHNTQLRDLYLNLCNDYPKMNVKNKFFFFLFLIKEFLKNFYLSIKQ